MARPDRGRWPQRTAVRGSAMLIEGLAGASAAQVLSLQARAGNGAVAHALQRAPGAPAAPAKAPAAPAKAPAAPAKAPAAAAKPVPPALSDARIAWIQDLPATVRGSIDANVDTMTTQIRALDVAIAKYRPAIDAAKDADAKATATTALESSKEKKAKDKLEQLHGATWAKRRVAMMDYLGCSLGGDAGVKKYFTSLVKFGAEELYVHPEVALRLGKVRDVLATENISMPSTSVGFGLRGHHVHPKKENQTPGMMTHALGVAVDWYAYKNIHFKDEQLMALVTAVTGRSHRMQLPLDAVKTIAAMGEQTMGKTLTAAQVTAAAKGEKLLETIGKEFEELERASDTFRDSLTFSKDDLLALHRELTPLARPVAKLREDVGKSSGSRRAALQTQLTAAEAVMTAKMTELRPKLQALFAPWLAKLAAEVKAIEDEAAKLGVDVRDVTTQEGLKSIASSVATGAAPAKKALAAVLTKARGPSNNAATVAAAVAGAQNFLEKRGTPAQKEQWATRLADLRTRAEGLGTQLGAIRTEVHMLQGAEAKPPAAVKPGPARLPTEREIAAWERTLAGVASKAPDVAGALATAKAAVPKDVVAQAEGLRDRRAMNKAISGSEKVGATKFGELQNERKKLFQLETASRRLLEDATFMFKDVSARDPGVAQLMGALDKGHGGGGFFGAPDSARPDSGDTADQAKKKRAMPGAGFTGRFFQEMARHGFEPAAAWHQADTMHFQLRGLVEAIVPGGTCETPTAEATAFADAAVESHRALSAK